MSLNNQNIQQALDWLLVNANETAELYDKEPDANPVLKLSSDNENVKHESTQNEALNANSLKCDDCGVLLKDEDFATLHAHKTGHVNFSQSAESLKPKTKEEIEEQKQRLSEKLKKLRHEREEKEKQEQLEREKLRRKEGRQLNEIKQKFHEEEMKRIADQKKREKIADAEYKRKLKEQIARDREEFKNVNKTQPSVPVAAPVLPSISTEKKDYNECRIQIRLTDGSTILRKFDTNENLAAVRLWIEENRKDGTGSFNIMQTFPRKVFTEDDMLKTLADLGLVPASSLVISRV